MALANPEGNRPPGIPHLFLPSSGVYDQTLLMAQVRSEEMNTANRGHESDSLLTLGRVGMKAARITIAFINTENRGHRVHPAYSAETFAKLSPEDQSLVLYSYGFITMTAGNVTLRRIVDEGIDYFDHQHFQAEYNFAVQNTNTPKLQPTSGFRITTGEVEQLRPEQIAIIKQSFARCGSIDFHDNSIWSALPVSLPIFIMQMKLEDIIRNTLSPAFIDRLREVEQHPVDETLSTDPWEKGPPDYLKGAGEWNF